MDENFETVNQASEQSLLVEQQEQPENGDGQVEPSLGAPEHTPEELLKADELNKITKSIKEQLETLAGQVKTDAETLIDELVDKLSPEAKKKLTYVEQILKLLEEPKYNIELFCDRAEESFITVTVDEHGITAGSHRETHKIRSKGFKKFLRGIWYRKKNKGIVSSTLDEVLDTLESKAVHSQIVFDTHTRIAHHQGAVYVDLCDSSWKCVQITAAGVSIIQEAPVKFIRCFGMAPLPEPVWGGNPIQKFNKLRALLNVTDTTWQRIVAWTLAAYSKGPYWTLMLTGEQGTAKSLSTRLIRNVVDPSMFELLTAPEEQRDVLFAAINGHVLAIDNLSGIKKWLSDLLCGINTGTATRLRAYHTNDGSENAFTAIKPVILNGIDLSIRDDLASRVMPAQLSEIKEPKPEEEILKEFEVVLPEVLGGIFEIIAEVLKNLPNTKTPTIRMADAGRWVTAAEKALGWKDGEFMEIYKESRDETVELSIDSDLFGSALVELLQENPHWEGTAASLRNILLLNSGHDRLRPPLGWPLTGKAVGGSLRRLAPALRHPNFGFQYEYKKAGNKRWYKFSPVKKRNRCAQNAHVPEETQNEALDMDTLKRGTGTLKNKSAKVRKAKNKTHKAKDLRGESLGGSGTSTPGFEVVEDERCPICSKAEINCECESE